ncbi:uncharacterized protein BO66DRAFT_438894 [Aspergillus aculeatinus CBS 121060]|uniref:Uncharacterized protein n=1 Tax=Aspergillus aculeatinus CBS 121060 TaxID=1448322 RepID=A0ACD1H8V7_9EURO|nr:hypothetical protein BO66DRAFT_438894 [Aspergillus aculeatinus CBS 121060]RAH69819.1 hypothetical protein BO66DRAFT_438894 [Aspergillus aculeatinus CBS 121060]
MNGHPLTIIDTPELVSQLMDDLLVNPTEDLYVDLEGENLCRHGTITIVALHLIEPRRTYLVDVHTLGDTAFHTSAAVDNTTTLKAILESHTRTKVFFDVRNDSDALRVLYDILLQGVKDVQIMELGFRQCIGGGWLRGLRSCVRNSTQIGLSAEEKNRWLENKWQMARKFRSMDGEGGEHHDRGLTQRPLTPEAVEYSAGDVVLLPQLRREYMDTLDDFWMWFVERETAARVEESQDDGYVPHGRRKALVPWTLRDFEERIKEYDQMIEDEYYSTDNDESEASDAEDCFFWFHEVSFWFYEVSFG